MVVASSKLQECVLVDTVLQHLVRLSRSKKETDRGVDWKELIEKEFRKY